MAKHKKTYQQPAAAAAAAAAAAKSEGDRILEGYQWGAFIGYEYTSLIFIYLFNYWVDSYC